MTTAPISASSGPTVRSTVLENGVRVVTESIPWARSVSMTVMLDCAIERIQDDPDSGADADSQANLGIAHLNLLQSNQALTHLKRASKLSPNGEEIKNAVRNLESRQQVMIVDDSPTIRTAVFGILERSRYRPVGAEDGFDALARLNEEIPEVIISEMGIYLTQVLGNSPYMLWSSVARVAVPPTSDL